MSLDEETLETAANGGLMDFEKWNSMVEPLVTRLEHIVFNVFPMPQVPPDATASTPPIPQGSTSELIPATSGSNKENDTPASTIQSSTDRVPDSQPEPPDDPATGAALPAPLLLLLDSVRSNLRTLFASKPPHTIQRLAELILRPTAHYRTLPAYLRAVDRVVSVTSSADVFPLRVQEATSQPNGVMNGGEGSFLLPDHALGSDESLGGALLTPIPWLRNAASPGAEDAALETEGDESVFAVAPTEQPIQQESEQTVGSTQETTLPAQPVPSTVENQAMEGTGSPPADASEDIPHARGPRVLGVEDMGLQDGKGVEMTLPAAEDNPSKQSDQQEQSEQPAPETDNKQAAGKESADGDGDIVLGDIQGAGEQSPASAETQKTDE
ncbi:hypothetical protein P170DRAFT_432784 [Aspergillus steynii IBT 23096]|uniref:PPP4R2-domain-containing protein n=1 Tax=Aspergillus steynii IBT 23096 TaxID=1392250 RepID=A0A2I2GQU0_9EURO|nr:uncharacterized protein P170DRAFT_432784 [Aspergillus steynii IBT 23096]PLB55252.1 hypothetical protein P170DRAFT_432784 [Aspergillus steynii IBT 23096]